MLHGGYVRLEAAKCVIAGCAEFMLWGLIFDQHWSLRSLQVFGLRVRIVRESFVVKRFDFFFSGCVMMGFL